MDDDEKILPPDRLSLESATDLIAELGRRYDTLVVIGVKELQTGKRSRMVRWKGDPLVAIAGAVMAQREVEEYIARADGLAADDVARD